jgi:acetyltransferase-like isoleucine patch superfamily enzyme
MGFIDRLRLAVRRRISRRVRTYLHFEPQSVNARFWSLVKEGRIVIGRHTIQTPEIKLFIGDDDTKLRIGSYSSISTESLMILGGEHHPEWVTTFGIRSGFGMPGAYEDGHPGTRGDIVIGSDVWLCPGTIVRSGVTIGDGAVVGAGSVVTRNVRPYAIVAGNPAVEVRRRFSDEQIDALLAIKWWDWPDDRVKEWVHLLCSPNIDDFIERARSEGYGG